MNNKFFKKELWYLKYSTHHGPANHIHNELTYIHSFWLFSLTCWSVKSIVTIVIWCSDAMCSICFFVNNYHRQVVWFSRPEGQHRNHHRDHYPWHHLHPELLSIHARHQHHYCTSFTVSGARGYGYNFSIISHRQMNNDFLHS